MRFWIFGGKDFLLRVRHLVGDEEVEMKSESSQEQKKKKKTRRRGVKWVVEIKMKTTHVRLQLSEQRGVMQPLT